MLALKPIGLHVTGDRNNWTRSNSRAGYPPPQRACRSSQRAGRHCLDSLWSSVEAQSAGQAPVLGGQTLGPILSLPGWDTWIQNGQIVPLYEGEIALLNSIAGTPVFGDAAETRAREVAAQVQAMQPNAEPAYVTAFLTFAGLQNTNVFRQWHEASYAKHSGKDRIPIWR